MTRVVRATPWKLKELRHGRSFLGSPKRVILLSMAAGGCFALLALLLATMGVDNSNGLSAPQQPPISLSQVYSDIASKALLVEDWPDSTTSDKLFKRDEHGSYLIPFFREAEAPLAVAALLDRIEAASRIIGECDLVFDLFVSELRVILTLSDDDLLKLGATPLKNGIQHMSSDNQRQMEEELERRVWRIPKGTHHITVAVFQEHPSILLKESDRRRWRPVPEPVAEKVYHQISTHQRNNDKLQAPRLQLDSLLLTGDGAMIAGFVDRSDSFQKIRLSCAEIARSIIGDLTSRPKQLIHVTVGRVLALPNKTSPVQQKAVINLVRRYNTQILPEKLAAMQSTLPNQASFDLIQLTMIRDIVWTLRRIKEYGTWPLLKARHASGD